MFFATFFTGMAAVYNPHYVPMPWHVWLIYTPILTCGTLIVVYANRFLPHLTSISLFLYVTVFLTCIIVPLAMHSGRPFQDTSQVFTHFSNVSGWNSVTAFIIGWMLSAFSFTGIDAATHLSEEIPNPAIRVPQAMVGAIATGCIMSFCFLVALLFCVTDINEVITSPTGVPVLAIFLQATNSRAASVALTGLLTVNLAFTTISGVIVCGRTTWAFARDNGLPFSEYFSAVNNDTEVPLRATVLSTCLMIVYGAVYVGSSVAFQSMVGSGIVMLSLTYVVPQGVLAIRGRQHLHPRPFNLGKAGRPLNILAPILFTFLTIMVALPYVLPVEVESMNYLSVVVSGIMFTIVVSWFISKRGVYHGPTLFTD